MPKQRELNPYPIFDLPLVHAAFIEEGVKELNEKRLWNFLIRQVKQKAEETKGKTNRKLKGEIKEIKKEFEEKPWHLIESFPLKAKKVLDEKFAFLTSTVVEETNSGNGTTTKLLVELQDKQRVEAVIIGHTNRVTLCVSSQVGCAMGCTFCATGTMGLKGNLLAGEIVEQLVHASLRRPITNVVFMGMGEPLHNYDQVLAAINIMIDPEFFALSKLRVTVSTVGVIPKMIQMTNEAPHVTLALSLHAPTQELRLKLVPSAKTYKLDKLMEALDYIHTETKRRTLVEYVLLDGVNDTEEIAHELGALLKGRSVHLNLIPYNPTDVLADYKRPSPENVHKFNMILRSEYQIFTTVRKEMGDDVAAACGQLSIQGIKKKAASKKSSSSSTCDSEGDMEDLFDSKDRKRSSPRKDQDQKMTKRKDRQGRRKSTQGEGGSERKDDVDDEQLNQMLEDAGFTVSKKRGGESGAWLFAALAGLTLLWIVIFVVIYKMR